MTAQAEQYLFIQATSDPACYHGSLLIATTLRPLLQKTPLPLECYYHRGEAIRLLNQLLGDVDTQTNDATIAAIICLATFEVNQTLDLEKSFILILTLGLDKPLSE
jgi:hypothetical protein